MAIFTGSRDNANKLLSPCVIWMILFSMTLMTTRVYGAPFFQFFQHNILTFQDDDNGEHAVDLTEAPFTISGQSYDHLYVGTNGQITVEPAILKTTISTFPLSTTVITGLWVDNDLAEGGYMKLGLTMDDDELLPFTNSISIYDSGFVAYAAVVTTWYGMKEQGGGSSDQNLYQVVLARDVTGLKTYAIFNYNSVQWGTGGDVGFNFGDGFMNFAHLPGVDYGNLEESLVINSNIGIPGRYVLSIDRVNSCEVGWTLNPLKNTCHKAIKKYRMNFEDARTFCQNLGGDLATEAQSWKDRKHITDLITFRGHLWIGVQDPDTDGRYNLINGVPVTLPPFKRGRPSSGSNHCVTMKMNRWYDKKCSKKFFFVCKRAPV